MDSKALPAAAGNRVYEEVQPQYKWLPGESFDTLIVDLRAFQNEKQFTKEHLKVQIDNYGNIKVSGERPLGGNRWSRFQKVNHLPEYCNPSGIRATYDDGVLSVVIPKLAKGERPVPPTPPPSPADQKPPTATQAAPAPAKEPAAAPAKAETRKPATAPVAPAPKKLEDRKSRTKPAEDGKSDAQQAAQEKGKEQVTSAPASDGKVAATTDQKEPEPAAADAGSTPSPPVPAEKATPDVRKPPAPAEAEKLRSRTSWLDLGVLRRRPRRLLVNVVVAVLLLLVLGFYFIYRHRATPDDQNEPGSLSME